MRFQVEISIDRDFNSIDCLVYEGTNFKATAQHKLKITEMCDPETYSNREIARIASDYCKNDRYSQFRFRHSDLFQMGVNKWMAIFSSEITEDRRSLCIELSETLKSRGHLIPKDIFSADIIVAVARALDKPPTEWPV